MDKQHPSEHEQLLIHELISTTPISVGDAFKSGTDHIDRQTVIKINGLIKEWFQHKKKTSVQMFQEAIVLRKIKNECFDNRSEIDGDRLWLTTRQSMLLLSNITKQNEPKRYKKLLDKMRGDALIVDQFLKAYHEDIEALLIFVDGCGWRTQVTQASKEAQSIRQEYPLISNDELTEKIKHKLKSKDNVVEDVSLSESNRSSSVNNTSDPVVLPSIVVTVANNTLPEPQPTDKHTAQSQSTDLDKTQSQSPSINKSSAQPLSTDPLSDLVDASDSSGTQENCETVNNQRRSSARLQRKVPESEQEIVNDTKRLSINSGNKRNRSSNSSANMFENTHKTPPKNKTHRKLYETPQKTPITPHKQVKELMELHDDPIENAEEILTAVVKQVFKRLKEGRTIATRTSSSRNLTADDLSLRLQCVLDQLESQFETEIRYATLKKDVSTVKLDRLRQVNQVTELTGTTTSSNVSVDTREESPRARANVQRSILHQLADLGNDSPVESDVSDNDAEAEMEFDC